MFNSKWGERRESGRRRRRGGVTRLVFLANVLAITAVGGSAAHAGYYKFVSSTGGSITASGGSAPTLPVIPYGETSNTAGSFSYGTSDPRKPATLTAGGTITTTYQWVPSYTGESPAGVTVTETLVVAESGQAYLDSNGNCTFGGDVYTDLGPQIGLPLMPIYTYAVMPPKLIGYSIGGSSGKTVTYHLNGASTLAIHRSPSATITTSMGGCTISISGSIQLQVDTTTAMTNSDRHRAEFNGLRYAGTVNGHPVPGAEQSRPPVTICEAVSSCVAAGAPVS